MTLNASSFSTSQQYLNSKGFGEGVLTEKPVHFFPKNEREFSHLSRIAIGEKEHF
jgi:hypothetical protein